MTPQAIVSHKLALAIRLLDCATGRDVFEDRVVFHMPPNIRAPIPKAAGTYIFINIPREDFCFQMDVYGYESREVNVRFGEVDEHSPIVDVGLMPLDYPKGKYETLVLRGSLPGIQSITAIRISEPVYTVSECDERRKTVEYRNPHNVTLPITQYGLYIAEKNAFLALKVEERVTPTKVLLKEMPYGEIQTRMPIMRVIDGLVKENGEYLLKVPDRTPAEYLIRFVVGEEIYFQTVDMTNPEALSVETQKGGS